MTARQSAPVDARRDSLGRLIRRSAIPPARYGQRLDDRWKANAACRPDGPNSMNPREADEVFFPIQKGERHARASTARARALCARCPVAVECLTFALAANVTDGIWGGTTIEDRKRLKCPN